MTAVGVHVAGTEPAARTSSSRWLALSGVLFALLLGAAVTMTSGMPDAKNAAKVQAWDLKHTNLLSGAALTTLVAVIVGLVFLTWLHSQLARGAGWVGNLFLVGAVIFGLSGTVAAGLNAVLGGDAKHLSTGSLQLMASLSQDLNAPMTCAGLALMYLAAGILIRRTGLLPGWLAWVSWLFALLAATFILGFIPLAGSALWMIVVGVYLYVRPPAEA
jgi:hypothetical protein